LIGEPTSPPPSAGNFDAALTTALQEAVPEALRPVLDAASLLGGTPGWLLLALLAFWWSGSRLGVRVAIVVASSAVLNVYLKWMFAHPRPYFLSDQVRALQPSDGFGMPSGHAQGSATAWGALARWGGARWLWVTGAVMTFLSGFSRVYFGVHSLLQVVSGWVVGAAVVILASALEPPLTRWWGRASTAARWAVAIAPAALVFAGGIVLRAALFDGWETPQDWADRHRAVALRLDPLGLAADLLLIDLGALARWTGALLGASLAALHYASPGRRPVAVGWWRERASNTAIGLPLAAGLLTAGELLLRRGVGVSAEILRFAAVVWVSAVVVPRLGRRLAAPARGRSASIP